jgi:DNA-binding NtrC family response regulator/pSer/pThr/pTyr-binding forkhead associated (FHA) protein
LHGTIGAVAELDTFKAFDLDVPDTAPEARVFLSIYHQDGFQVIPLKDELVLGRSQPSTLILDDPKLSRTHCKFSVQKEQIALEDLGSTNGTSVNGVKVERATLGPGDEVLAGDVAVVVNVVRSRRRPGPTALDHEEWVAQVDRELARASSFGRTAAVVALGLKLEGDQDSMLFLPAVAKTFRPIDLCVSFAGREILVMLPEANRPEAVAAGERARIALVRSGMPLPDIGVALYPADGATVDDLVAAARRPLKVARTGKSPTSSKDAFEVLRYPVEGREIAVADKAMIRVAEAAKKLAASTLPALIQGETGVGKELVAELIHFASARKDRPFVRINCGALSATLAESELFGHVKGAFTGADRNKTGLFVEADGGTILLDEIGEMPKEIQVKLLRVLEGRKVLPVGSTKEVSVDLRVIAATNRDLAVAVEEGTFRRDLLYRLNAATLFVPPLRERPADIPVIVESVLERLRRAGEKVGGIRPETIEQLSAHDWPGNVRELVNAVEHANLLADGDPIGPEHLSGRVRDAGPNAGSGDYRSRLRAAEEEMIRAALKKTRGNQSEAARLLKMPRRTLVHKMRQLNLREG